MAQENPNKLVEWYLALKEWAPTVPQHFRAWLEAVRAEPYLIWQTHTVRDVTYGMGCIVLLIVASSLPEWIAGPPPADAQPQAVTAYFDVICTEPDCGYHFSSKQKMSFHKFPIRCLRCKKRTAVHARRCMSEACDGKLVAPVKIEKSLRCPHCGRAVGQ